MPPKQRKPNRPNRKKNRQRDTAKEKADEFGFAYNFFKSDDELWELLQDAKKGDWGPQRFQAKLKETKWFRKHSDIWRQNTALRYSDPATYRERYKNVQSQMANISQQWGADLGPKELQRFSQRAFLLGWDEGQILNMVSKKVRPNKSGHYGGQLSGIEAQLRQTAMANGVKLSREQLRNWMRNIVRGNADSRQFETYIRDIAAKTYTAYAQEIRGGMNAVDVAAPYIQSMSEILELNPADINMFDRTIRGAMSAKDEKGKPAPRSLTDFEDQLRRDRRWQYTDSAHEQLQGYGIALGKAWGLL